MSTIDTIRNLPEPSSSFPTFGSRFTRVSGALAGWLQTAMQKRRTRRALLALSDVQLKDIGVSPADAYREGLRPFWD